jgi:hypothetical protein
MSPFYFKGSADGEEVWDDDDYFAYVFVFLDRISVSLLDKLALTGQSQVTVQLRVSLWDLV